MTICAVLAGQTCLSPAASGGAARIGLPRAVAVACLPPPEWQADPDGDDLGRNPFTPDAQVRRDLSNRL